jgi:hypothetical protein
MHAHSWMSRAEAAAHLRISVRQLDRLRLTRSYIGRRALYSRETLDGHLHASQTTPRPPQRAATRSSSVVPLLVVPCVRRGSRDSDSWLDDLRAALKAA